MKNGNCVHADVGMVCCVHGSRKLASLLIFYLMFVLFFVVVFVFVLLAYCSVVWAFVPHLEFLFLLVQGSAIVCFFFFFFCLLLLFLRSQCVERCRLVIIMKFTMQGQSISA